MAFGPKVGDKSRHQRQNRLGAMFYFTKKLLTVQVGEGKKGQNTKKNTKKKTAKGQKYTCIHEMAFYSWNKKFISVCIKPQLLLDKNPGFINHAFMVQRAADNE